MVAAIVGTVISGAAPASAARTIIVGPGGSIQAAVDRAHPGDTVLIKPGHYAGSVLVTTDRLEIRGSGAGSHGTVIVPGAPNPADPCSPHGENGICLLGRPGNYVNRVHVSNLLVQGFSGTGVLGLGTAGMTVENVYAADNGEYGIARFSSTRSAILRNKAWGNGEAGIYIGDSPNAYTEVTGNEVWDNQFGIFYRHSRSAIINYNIVRANCVGILALSAPPTPPAGAVQIIYNTIKNNNKLCPASDETPADVKGGGIVFVGVTDAQVEHNAILGNRGATFASGGMVLLNGASLQAGGPSTRNLIRNNTLFRNAPADIVDHSGGRNSFRNNFCSRPSSLCRH